MEKGKTMKRLYVDITDICIPSDDNNYDELVEFADAIAEQETIEDVAPVRHGRWEDYEENTWQCSECGEPFYLEDGTPQENEYNYCPYCGAKMDKENKDEL